jgi:hypothetical protein
LQSAAGAQTGRRSLLYLLEQELEQNDDDPLAAARARGIVIRDELLAREGGLLTVDQVAQQLRLSRQAVEKRRKAGRLLAVAIGRRGYAYPAWQFTAAGVLPGLPETLQALPVESPVMRVAFFLNPNTYLDGSTPLAELKAGNFEGVLRAARAYGTHGAP